MKWLRMSWQSGVDGDESEGSTRSKMAVTASADESWFLRASSAFLVRSSEAPSNKLTGNPWRNPGMREMSSCSGEQNRKAFKNESCVSGCFQRPPHRL